MTTMVYGNWIADFVTLTCWNCVTKIVVSFEDNGNVLTGKIKDIPVELMGKLATEPHAARFMENAVMEAREIFLRAYNENGGGCCA